MGINPCHDCAERHHGLINMQHALGRLLWQSKVTPPLDWVGRSSKFNSCLPADIASYAAPPRNPPSLSQDEIQTAVSSLQNP
ncbi:hypothetical protein BD769DRAFT_1439155, partial [Suillus cothurnatus]